MSSRSVMIVMAAGALFTGSAAGLMNDGAHTTGQVPAPHEYTLHDSELPLQLQQHGNRVHFRNIWIRRVYGYDHVASAPKREAAPADRTQRTIAVGTVR